MNRIIQPRWIALSEQVYRALIFLYPADYRREYGALMVQVFRDVCRDTYRQDGLLGAALWWLRTLLDLTLTVVEQRRKMQLGMSKSNFMHLAGLFLVIGGAFGAVSAFSQLQPGDHYTYYGVYQVLLWLIAPSFFFIGLGTIGLGMRFAEPLGKVGQWTAYVMGVASLGMTFGMVASWLNEDMWNVWYVLGLVHVAALTLFALLHLFNRALPIFRALPLQLAAGWWFVWLGFPALFPEVTRNLLLFLMMGGIGLVWLAIGLAIHRQQRAAVLSVA
jgi:hypothetical protein